MATTVSYLDNEYIDPWVRSSKPGYSGRTMHVGRRGCYAEGHIVVRKNRDVSLVLLQRDGVNKMFPRMEPFVKHTLGRRRRVPQHGAGRPTTSNWVTHMVFINFEAISSP